jgi:hypothetical protein
MPDVNAAGLLPFGLASIVKNRGIGGTLKFRALSMTDHRVDLELRVVTLSKR